MLGGEYSELEKKNLVNNISALMIQYAKYLKSKSDIELNNIVNFNNLLKIPYDEEIYELCIRLRENSNLLQFLPQIFDIIAFEIILPSFGIIDKSAFKTNNNFEEKELDNIRLIIRHVILFLERIEAFPHDQMKFLFEF